MAIYYNADRTKYDPTLIGDPSTPNIPYFTRLRKELNLTQMELAREAEVTRIAVLRNEHLSYPTPFPNIASKLSLLCTIPLKQIVHEYHIDVARRRKYVAENLLPWSLTRTISYGTFMDWRLKICAAVGLASSVTNLSSMLCVHPNIIRDFEVRNNAAYRRGDSYITSIPRSLAVALREMHYPNTFLLDIALIVDNASDSDVAYDFTK